MPRLGDARCCGGRSRTTIGELSGAVLPTLEQGRQEAHMVNQQGKTYVREPRPQQWASVINGARARGITAQRRSVTVEHAYQLMRGHARNNHASLRTVARAGSQMSKVCVPGGHVPLRTLVRTFDPAVFIVINGFARVEPPHGRAQPERNPQGSSNWPQHAVCLVKGLSAAKQFDSGPSLLAELAKHRAAERGRDHRSCGTSGPSLVRSVDTGASSPHVGTAKQGSAR